MKTFQVTRPTVFDMPPDMLLEEVKAKISDAGHRRHLSHGFDFDTRAHILETEIGDDWEPHVKTMWETNKANVRAGLIREYGELAIETKIENFLAIGAKPMSVLSYHNAFYHQVRSAYVMGHYYPALVSACALGERILNHLVLDLREHYRTSPEYKNVYNKKSFDKWDIALRALNDWKILLPEAAAAFEKLKVLRRYSVHFNVSTYTTLKEDALAAVLHMREIINQQFGTWGLRPWLIRGTKGQIFIAKDWETHPFIATYFLPRAPFVGPLFGMAHDDARWNFYDVPDYGDGGLTDAQFAAAYNDRSPDDIVSEPFEIEYVGDDGSSTG
jgi:hypothetical protein